MWGKKGKGERRRKDRERGELGGSYDRAIITRRGGELTGIRVKVRDRVESDVVAPGRWFRLSGRVVSSTS